MNKKGDFWEKEFASRYEMHMKDAYIYLAQNEGIDFLKEFYDVEQTFSFDEVLDDLAMVCEKMGVRFIEAFSWL